MKYKITRNCNCEDFKTSLVHSKRDLVIGEIVEGYEMKNLYGIFLSVENKEGNHYYIHPGSAEKINE
jgi:hypothetical protein